MKTWFFIVLITSLSVLILAFDCRRKINPSIDVYYTNNTPFELAIVIIPKDSKDTLFSRGNWGGEFPPRLYNLMSKEVRSYGIPITDWENSLPDYEVATYFFNIDTIKKYDSNYIADHQLYYRRLFYRYVDLQQMNYKIIVK